MKPTKTNQDKLRGTIEEIITYHSDDGTSGYALSNEQIDQLLALFNREYKERKKECFFDLGNKTCKGVYRTICSVHIDSLWKQREKELDIKQHFNEPQAESLERLGDAVWGMHNADIKVRKDGRDIWFEADWLRQIVPILLKALEKTK